MQNMAHFSIGLHILSLICFIQCITDDRTQCLIKIKSDCESECNCSESTLAGNKDEFLRIISKKSVPCDCKGTCENDQFILQDCFHGICDEENHECRCHNCWSGKSCDILVVNQQPQFIGPIININIKRSVTIGSVIAQLCAKCEDICNESNRCDCSGIKYEIVETEGIPFSIDDHSDEVKVSQVLIKEKYTFNVVAKQLYDTDSHDEVNEIESTVKIAVVVDDDEIEKERKYHVERRAAEPSLPSCEFTSFTISVTPDTGEKLYFGHEEKIRFRIYAYHKQSSSAKEIERLFIGVSSKYLKVNPEAVIEQRLSTEEKLSQPSIYNSGLSFEVERLPPDATYEAYIDATVMDSSQVFDELSLDINYHAVESSLVDHCEQSLASHPIIYVEGPILEVLQTVKRDFYTRTEDGPIQYSISLTMPMMKLGGVSLEIKSISDSSLPFLTVSAVKLSSMGSEISLSGSREPKYKNGDEKLGYTHVYFNFETVVAKGKDDRRMQIYFGVSVNDNDQLANGTEGSIDVSIYSESKLLKNVTLTNIVIKEEPTLQLKVGKDGFSNSGLLFIGDLVTLEIDLFHTSVSNEDARDVSLTFVGDHIIPSRSSATTITEQSDSTFSSLVGDFKWNERKTISVTFEIKDDVRPFIILALAIKLGYYNYNMEIKKKTLEFKTTGKIGAPTFTVTQNIPQSAIRPGQKLCFTISALFEKINCRAQFKFYTQYVDDGAAFYIDTLETKKIGSNILRLNDEATMSFDQYIVSSKWKIIAQIDYGIGYNSKEGDTNDNKISLDYCVILYDHPSITNDSVVYLGVGMNDDKMNLLRQLTLSTFVPYPSRPYLELNIESLQLIQKGMQFSQSISLGHQPESSREPTNQTLTIFLPFYMKFNTAFCNSTCLNFTYEYKHHYVIIKNFAKLSFYQSFIVQLHMETEDDIPEGAETGFINVRSTYGVDDVRYYGSKSIKFPVSTSLKPSLEESLPNGCKPEYYKYGFAVVRNTSTSLSRVFACVGRSVTPSDFGRRCYVTIDAGESWTKTNPQVGAVIGLQNDSETLFAVSEDCASYIKYDGERERWLRLNKQQLPKDVIQSYTVLSRSSSGGPPSDPSNLTMQTDDTFHVGITGDGIYFSTITSPNWNKKLVHSCPSCH